GALLSVAPDSALLLLESGETAEIPLSAVKTGDKLVVRPGSRIPADGVVIDGHSAIDLSLLTGESIPEAAGPGDKLVGGSLNGEGSLVMEVQATGQNTKLSRIIRLVREAQGSKAPIARLADKASYYFVPAVMLFAVLSAAAWALFSREPYTVALTVFVAILVMACPCAMGLATPMSIMVGAGRGASLGVLIKNGAALERAGRINALCVDKTGTLTAGKPALTSVISLKTPGGTISRKQLLSIAASLEGRSEHPLGLAIIEAAKNENCEYGAASNISIRPGLGIAGDIAFDNALYYAGIGNEAFAREHGLEINPDTGDKLASLADEGQTPLLMFARQPGGELGLTAIFALADQLRPETPDVIARLKKMGVRPVMLTGDNDRTARAIAKAAGIEEFYARLLPERKAGFIKKLREEGKIVGMVGDGLNDAPALATADVGFAVGDGVDVSAEAGDIVLMRGGMRAILTALELSRATMRNIKENLGWAFGYNILGLPVAAGLLYAFGGPMLSPMIAGLAMALSSFSVVMNASRLRGFGKKADGTR
ncbi:MAG: heavy metal translocating P-type ATPase, partial [Desulfovibrio sp.]|nr:heavy metal translocating P-type ATPase [Desulfovibrio sp.]